MQVLCGVSDIRYTDAITLFEYGFNNFEKAKILDKKDYSFTYTDYNSKLNYTYSLASDVQALVNDKNNDMQIINYTISLDHDKLKQYNINSSDYENQVIGSIKVEFRQNTSSYDKDFDLVLNSISKIPKSKSEKFKTTITTIFIVLLVFLVITNKKKAKKSKHMNYTKYRRR